MMDVGANAMFANATVKGTIDTIPEVPGLAVWVDGHIGIYIENGEVIEAMNTLRGVTRTQLAGREWTHWLQIPYISYVQKPQYCAANLVGFGDSFPMKIVIYCCCGEENGVYKTTVQRQYQSIDGCYGEGFTV